MCEQEFDISGFDVLVEAFTTTVRCKGRPGSLSKKFIPTPSDSCHEVWEIWSRLGSFGNVCDFMSHGCLHDAYTHFKLFHSLHGHDAHVHGWDIWFISFTTACRGHTSGSMPGWGASVMTCADG